MKIKNFKYYSTILLLATSLGIGGCGSSNNKLDELVIDTLVEEDTSLENNNSTILTDSEIHSIIEDINLYFNNSISMHYYHTYGIITIYGPLENEIIPELNDRLYEKLNTLLEQANVKALEIHNLGNEINFSKLNISNIEDITLDNCKTDFNYEPFKQQKYENVLLENIAANKAIEIAENSFTENTNVDYINFNTFNDSSRFIQTLVEKEISINNFYLATEECSLEDHNNLAKMNAKNIEIMFSTPTDQTYNVELHLYENIESFKIWNIGSNISTAAATAC